MLDLLTALSVKQIITYFILFLLAIRGGIDLFNYFKDLYLKKFDKDYKNKEKEKEIIEHYEECNQQHQESMEKYDLLEHKIDFLTDTMNEKIDKIEKQLTLLTESDMHDIKGWIVEKHHLLTERGWVDDFTMDTLEHRYSDYKAEDGNSYIETLMMDLRKLPHFPVEK